MTWLWCSLLAAAGLILVPWGMHGLASRRPRWSAPVTASFPGWRTAHRGMSVVAAWGLLALAAVVLPLSSGWVGADLDAGLLWFAVLAGASWLAHGGARLGGRAVAGVALAGLGVVLPVVLRVASLNVSDMVVAQQGGAGNWFLVREPFLLLSALGYLFLAAAVWNALRASRGASNDAWSWCLDLAQPLVAAHLFAVLYLGGWWAFVPFADGLPWLNTGLKAAVALAAILALSRRPGVDVAALRGGWPAVTLLVALGSLAWLVIGGAVR